MRRTFSAVFALTLVGATFYLGAQPQTERVKLRIKLVDAATGKPMAGIVRVLDADKKYVELPGLFDRITGLTKDNPGVHWYCVPLEGADTTLPRAKLHIDALSGLESGLTQQDLDFRTKSPDELTLKLPLLFRPDDSGLSAGNTHLHLRGFSQDLADEYLRKIPAADGLRVMFISYLERNKDDESYITNKYPIGDLPKLSATGVLFNNGEEHRHNFKGYGEGYGHVMFLNIKELVQPVSIGPGITGKGVDDLPLRPGIDNAKKQGGTIIWCHNTNGFEDVPSALTGRLDALNVFDGSRTGKFEETYYRYLNLGIRLPISTGTDWFMYDFSRVYAEVRGKLTIASWLNAVKAGRCQATNGPLLTLTVDGHKIGDVIDLKDTKTVKIQASAIGRHPVQKLQLIQNGKVIKTHLARIERPGQIQFTHEVRLDSPAWFAVRIESDAKNEFDRTLFAHTSPVYVSFKGKSVFDLESALALLKQVEEGQALIQTHGNFSNAAAAKKTRTIYEDAARDLRDRINARR
ncbi:MAG: hypothetical protein EXR98_04780 [Gemmataceae bacterium]|nr:hypothetical protein [Gemmataceae bacterium]